MTPHASGGCVGARPDLVVFSHLRWSWVWQRPQHIVSRLAVGRSVWFIEEPVADPRVLEPTMRWHAEGSVTVGQLHVPGPERHVGFDDHAAAELGAIVARAAGSGVSAVWLYSPLALGAAQLLDAEVMVYDVMDDRASFRGASPQMRLRQLQALASADVVFTGGRSLHRSIVQDRPDETYLFPSGVETEHYALAAERRTAPTPPVAGYVGVIDERIDLDLLDGVAERLPDWEIRVVGPVATLDAESLPRRSNLVYSGPVDYSQLPDVMAQMHVALMPFALNEATRSISPTKILEYLAAGLPVVSTRVPDVVAEYGHVAALAADSAEFASACRRVLDEGLSQVGCRPILEWRHWDRIAARMWGIIASVGRHRVAGLAGPWTLLEPSVLVGVSGGHVAAPGLWWDGAWLHMFVPTDRAAAGSTIEHLVSDDGGRTFSRLDTALESVPELGEATIFDPHPAEIDGEKYLVYSAGERVATPDIRLARSDTGSWHGPWERLGSILHHEEVSRVATFDLGRLIAGDGAENTAVSGRSGSFDLG